MKKPTKGQRIEIRPAKIKGKKNAGFRVVTIAQNGEELSASKALTSPANVRKNIVALWNLMIDAAHSPHHDEIEMTWSSGYGFETPIIDLTGKVIKPVKK